VGVPLLSVYCCTAGLYWRELRGSSTVVSILLYCRTVLQRATWEFHCCQYTVVLQDCTAESHVGVLLLSVYCCTAGLYWSEPRGSSTVVSILLYCRTVLERATWEFHCCLYTVVLQDCTGVSHVGVPLLSVHCCTAGMYWRELRGSSTVVSILLYCRNVLERATWEFHCCLYTVVLQDCTGVSHVGVLLLSVYCCTVGLYWRQSRGSSTVVSTLLYYRTVLERATWEFHCCLYTVVLQDCTGESYVGVPLLSVYCCTAGLFWREPPGSSTVVYHRHIVTWS